MSKRSYADIVKQYEKPARRTWNWNWFGWLGLLCLLAFLSFIVFPDESDFFRSQPVSVMVIGAMAGCIVLPVLASLRKSKRWLIVAGCGALAALYFFLMIVA